MSNGLNSRTFGRQLIVWSVAAIVGITIAMVSVGFLGLWVLVGIGGAVVGTLATGLIGSALFCIDFDAVIEARRAAAEGRDISS
jgi:hypothetical protein